jgi:hypothetical protein
MTGLVQLEAENAWSDGTCISLAAPVTYLPRARGSPTHEERIVL